MDAKNFDECSQRPTQVRKIRPTRRSVSGFYVFRGSEQIAYESTLERDFIILMEHDLRVEEIIAQPCQLLFSGSSGQEYPYTPDFLVYFRGGEKPMLVEVKPADEWKKYWRKWSVKWKVARRYAKDQGWIFKIYDEGHIRNQTLSNIIFLQRFDRMMVNEDLASLIIEGVRKTGQISVEQLLGQMSENILLMTPLIWHFVAVRRIECDMTKPLGDHTLLWISHYE